MKNLDAQLVLLDEEHSGRDEMNLAGNPFALLQAASKAGQTFIKREWERTLASGKVVNASWEVNGHQELGLPGPQDELLYLVLLQLTREKRDEIGDWVQEVNFSRYDLLDRLGWGNDARGYNLLRDCFARLQSVSIQAHYSFYDPRIKGPIPSTGFNIIDKYEIFDERAGRKREGSNLPLSVFKWSDRLFQSLQSGNVRSLALDFTLSLDTPISRRLFRLLELLRHARKPALAEVRLEVFSIRDRLGMTAYAYPSKIKEKLQPAIEELVTRGYLDSVKYEKVKKVESAIFVFASIKPETGQSKAGQGNNPTTAPTAPKTPPKPQQMALLEEEPVSNVQADALRCYELFQTLPESEQAELLAIARREVSPIWHDRVGQPESPMSLGLWQLVAARYGERLK